MLNVTSSTTKRMTASCQQNLKLFNVSMLFHCVYLFGIDPPPFGQYIGQAWSGIVVRDLMHTLS
jgi:hypothetical protein